jgi:hypothetical protein
LTLDRVEFMGYGLDVPGSSHMDYRGRNMNGAAVIYLGRTPKPVDASTYRRLLMGRSRYATEQKHALATIGPVPANAPAGNGPGRGAANRANGPDFLAGGRPGAQSALAASGSDAFFEFLFSKAPLSATAEAHKAADQEELPIFTLDGVSLTFNIDADYSVVRTQLTDNVVAIVEGSDSQLSPPMSPLAHTTTTSAMRMRS